MEVGEHAIHDLVVVTGPDEELRGHLPGPHATSAGGERLERPYRSRPDSDDAASARLNGAGGLLWYVAALAVHRVLRQILRLNWAERVDPDVERHVRDMDPAIPNRVDEFGSEVQTGGRRGSAARTACIHRLVALRVGEFRVDVRRQRRAAQPRQPRAEAVGIDKAHDPSALSEVFTYLSLQAIAEGDHRARQQPFAWADQRDKLGFPARRVQQQRLDTRAGRLPSEQAQRGDSRVVEDQKVAWLQKLGNLSERSMVDLARMPVEVQQSAGRAIGERRLGDERLRQLVIVVAQAVDRIASGKSSSERT